MIKVALLMNLEIGYCRACMHGILEYPHSSREWFFREWRNDPEEIRKLKNWKPDALIGHIYSAKIAKELKTWNIPVINTTETLPDIHFPTVDVNHRKAGKMAAQYFLEKGYKNFAYLGSRWARFSIDRSKGFQETLSSKNYELHKFYADFIPKYQNNSNDNSIESALLNWILKLPKPIAILASNDIPARFLTQICYNHKIRIPDEVAILGIDNDESECRLSKIPLSSIALNAEKIGYVAAKTLDQRLQQSKVPKRQQLDPLYIVPRQSTDLFISKSESINEALQFIQENSRSIKNVLEVSQAVGISRRSLEKKFQNHLGRTLLQQIHLSKLSNAQRLLRETHLPIHQIPSQSGFLSERQMNTLFRKFLHLTPRQFRQKET
tara:strand:+ start:1668 stop:2807 length:1140 start_codon:yes stop_codon:yes gene_type:complete